MASRRGPRAVQVTVGVRGAAAGLAAAAAAVLWVVRRTSPEVSTRRRILRRLDAVAPKKAFAPTLIEEGRILNGECTCILPSPPLYS